MNRGFDSKCAFRYTESPYLTEPNNRNTLKKLFTVHLVGTTYYVGTVHYVGTYPYVAP